MSERIKVGDLIQYRYRSSALGTSLDTRAVIQIVRDGEAFVVEGFYNVHASQVLTHIPAEPESASDDYEWCGVIE